MNSITPFQSPRPSKKALRFLSRATAVVGDVPSMDKRNTMNLLLVGAASLPIGALAVPYALFFVPKSAGGGAGGTVAKDALGSDIRASEWLKNHRAGDRTLSQGLKGDPTYIVVSNDGLVG